MNTHISNRRTGRPGSAMSVSAEAKTVYLAVRLIVNLSISALGLILLTGCGSPGLPAPEFVKPRLVPNNWVADYSYEEPIGLYLRSQASIAISNSKKPIIYVFDDRSGGCVTFRHRVQNGVFGALFDDKHVIMLSHRYFHSAVRSINGRNESSLDVIGALIPIDENGNLAGPAMNGLVGNGLNQQFQLRLLERYFEQVYGGQQQSPPSDTSELNR